MQNSKNSFTWFRFLKVHHCNIFFTLNKFIWISSRSTINFKYFVSWTENSHLFMFACNSASRNRWRIFWHALCVLFPSYCISKYCLYILIQSRLNNQKTRHSCNIDMLLIHCTTQMKVVNICKRQIWFETSLNSLILNRLFECDEKLVWCSTLWNIKLFSNELTFQQLTITNICFFLISKFNFL